jgi:ABC-type multidrug transport system fused ATPase/permease subunit
MSLKGNYNQPSHTSIDKPSPAKEKHPLAQLAGVTLLVASCFIGVFGVFGLLFLDSPDPEVKFKQFSIAIILLLIAFVAAVIAVLLLKRNTFLRNKPLSRDPKKQQYKGLAILVTSGLVAILSFFQLNIPGANEAIWQIIIILSIPSGLFGIMIATSKQS